MLHCPPPLPSPTLQKFLLTLCCSFFLLAGCGPRQVAPPVQQLAPTNTIFALSRPDATPFAGERWVVLPAHPGIDPGDIMFQRFTKALHGWLQQHGRRVVTRPEEADTALFLTFNENNGTFLPLSARPKQILLAPVNGQTRALQFWSPLDAMPGYHNERNKIILYMFLHAAPLVRQNGEVFVAEAMWTLSITGGKGLFPPQPNAAKQLVDAIEGIPGTNK